MASWNDEIPIDNDYEDASSDDSFSRRSIATSISNYRYENGRRYHSYRDGQYWAPNDEQATSVGNISHHAFLLTMNDRLFLAPLHDPKRALDIGTGNGIWAQDFAESFPQAEVIGTDLSPIQSSIPIPNLHFEVDDCCSEWVYPKDHFDFIHVRQMYGSIADWHAFYRDCYDHLKPGGYLEQAEISPILKSDDGSIIPGDNFDECGKLAVRCGEAFGKSLLVQQFMRDEIERAGFVEVVEEKYKWPVGAWSTDAKLKELGRWNLNHWEQGLEGWTMRFFTRYLGWSFQATKEWNFNMRQTLRDRRYHVYQDISVVYARKPL